MDIVSYWKELKSNTQTDLFKTFLGFVRYLCREWLFNPLKFPYFTRLNEYEKERFYKSISYLIKGNVVEIGSLPQLPIVLIASLYFILKGERVICLTWNPLLIHLGQSFLEFYKDELGIDVGVREEKNIEENRKVFYNKDLVIVDYTQFNKDFYREKSLLEGKPTVGIIPEIDLSLYDRRILIFDKDDLKATAAVYRTQEEVPVWQGQKRIFDFKEIALLFKKVCGLTSGITGEVNRELAKTYKIVVKSVIPEREKIKFSALVFKSKEEKFKALCADAAKSESDVLIFYYSRESFLYLKDELEHKKVEVTPIFRDSEFEEFFQKNEGKKKDWFSWRFSRFKFFYYF